MSERLRKEITAERELLTRLLETHRELRDDSIQEGPNPVEISALAAMLHSFYTGIENALKRIAIHIDREMPGGPASHSHLLDLMAKPTERRPAVISGDLRDRLRAYLAFRHMFRHAYSFELRWGRMAPLVFDCENTFRQFERELEQFLNQLVSNS